MVKVRNPWQSPNVVYNDTCHNRADIAGLLVIYPTITFVQEFEMLSILPISGSTTILFASIFDELNNNPCCR